MILLRHAFFIFPFRAAQGYEQGDVSYRKTRGATTRGATTGPDMTDMTRGDGVERTPSAEHIATPDAADRARRALLDTPGVIRSPTPLPSAAKNHPSTLPHACLTAGRGGARTAASPCAHPRSCPHCTAVGMFLLTARAGAGRLGAHG